MSTTLLTFIRSIVTSGPVYVRIKKTWLSVRDVATGAEYQDKPLLAIKRQPSGSTVVSVGSRALAETAKQDVQIVNGYDHPRTVLNDFSAAEKTLAYFLKQVFASTILRPSPVLILHVQEQLEGGLTQVEVRALLELGAGVGGREVYIWEGRDLTDREISDRQYPDGHWLKGPPK